MLRRSVIMLLLLTLLGAGTAHAQERTSAIINGDVNLRTGPGTNFPVITVVPDGSTLTLLGRNQLRTWLYVDYEGQRGWMIYRYVNTSGSIRTLPVVDASGDSTGEVNQKAESNQGEAPAPDAGNADDEGHSTETKPAVDESAPPTQGRPDANVIRNIVGTSQEIFRRGQQMGNNAGVFAKVGDSITASDLFLSPIGTGSYELGTYDELQPVINFFSQTAARNHYSFASNSVAARGGFTTKFVLNPDFAPSSLCQPGETPLACEYRAIKPSVALIMLGTNDVRVMGAGTFEAKLSEIVQYSMDQGVIPVLSTIPDQPNTAYASTVLQFNRIIEGIAARYDVPLWDYRQAMQGLQNQGLSSDNVHPSHNPVFGTTAYFTPDGLRYGYNMRNLTALQVLDAIWRNIIQ